MSSIQEISNPFNLYAAKEVYSKSNPVRSADSNTAKALESAQKENFFSGLSVGLNYITNGGNDGIQNRHRNYKEIAFVEKHGFYPNPAKEWIA